MPEEWEQVPIVVRDDGDGFSQIYADGVPITCTLDEAGMVGLNPGVDRKFICSQNMERGWIDVALWRLKQGGGTGDTWAWENFNAWGQDRNWRVDGVLNQDSQYPGCSENPIEGATQGESSCFISPDGKLNITAVNTYGDLNQGCSGGVDVVYVPKEGDPTFTFQKFRVYGEAIATGNDGEGAYVAIDLYAGYDYWVAGLAKSGGLGWTTDCQNCTMTEGTDEHGHYYEIDLGSVVSPDYFGLHAHVGPVGEIVAAVIDAIDIIFPKLAWETFDSMCGSHTWFSYQYVWINSPRYADGECADLSHVNVSSGSFNLDSNVTEGANRAGAYWFSNSAPWDMGGTYTEDPITCRYLKFYASVSLTNGNEEYDNVGVGVIINDSDFYFFECFYYNGPCASEDYYTDYNKYDTTHDSDDGGEYYLIDLGSDTSVTMMEIWSWCSVFDVGSVTAAIDSIWVYTQAEWEALQ